MSGLELIVALGFSFVGLIVGLYGRAVLVEVRALRGDLARHKLEMENRVTKLEMVTHHHAG